MAEGIQQIQEEKVAPLCCEFHACDGRKVCPQPLVLLHGWGFDSAVWQGVLPRLKNRFDVITVDLPGFGKNSSAAPLLGDVQRVVDSLLEVLPRKFILLGWSLGGMLATRIAIQFPERVTALIAVASNLKWLAEGDWLGLLPDNFDDFFQSVKQQPQQTCKQFTGLVSKGDLQEKNVTRQLRQYLSDVSGDNLLLALLLLSSLDNRAAFEALKLPGLHIFGEKDLLVPLQVAGEVISRNPRQQVHVMADLAHAPFLSDPDAFIDVVMQFVSPLALKLEKHRVAQSFSRAASTYDEAASMQQEVGFELMALLPDEGTIPFGGVADLGCGTGYHLQELEERYARSKVVGLDLAMGMLQQCRQRSASVTLLAADAECLPFADNSLSLVYSSLAIQWCQDLPQLFSEIHRCLVPGGVCAISTFINGTLQEMREAWAEVDNAVHVNSFFDAGELQQQAESAGLASLYFEDEQQCRFYSSVQDLASELKKIGAHNLNAGQRTGLTTRQHYESFVRAYEQQRVQEGLPATWRVLYMGLQKVVQ